MFQSLVSLSPIIQIVRCGYVRLLVRSDHCIDKKSGVKKFSHRKLLLAVPRFASNALALGALLLLLGRRRRVGAAAVRRAAARAGAHRLGELVERHRAVNLAAVAASAPVSRTRAGGARRRIFVGRGARRDRRQRRRRAGAAANHRVAVRRQRHVGRHAQTKTVGAQHSCRVVRVGRFHDDVITLGVAADRGQRRRINIVNIITFWFEKQNKTNQTRI